MLSLVNSMLLPVTRSRTVGARLTSWRTILVILLFLAISVSPRVRIGTLATGRNVDLRYEDFILVLIVILWVTRLALQNRKRIYVSPIFKPIMIYLFLATLSTCIGVILGWIVPSMALFFYFKEIEYFLIFLVVANFIRTYGELKIATYSLVVFGIANGFYSIYQFLSGTFISGNYGTGSLGESATFPTAGYFMIILVLSTTVFWAIRGKTIRVISVISVVFCGIGLLFTGSRASSLGAILSFLVLLLIIVKESLKSKTGNIRLAYIMLVLLLVFLVFGYAFNYAVKKRAVLSRLIDISHMKYSLLETRSEEIYGKALGVIEKNPVAGLGKTASTTVLRGTGEAHNYYLRILAEMGILGLLAFLYMLLSIMKMSLKLGKNNQFALGRALGLGCLLATLSLMFTSISQDAFLPVKVNEIFWSLVGLTASAHRLNSRRSYRLLPVPMERI